MSTDLDTSATESNGKMVPPIDQAQRRRAQILRLRTTDGKDGGKRLFAACCRAIEWDLSDEEAIGAIRSYHAERPFPTVWTDTQIVDCIRAAEEKADRGEKLQAKKARKTTTIPGSDVDGDGIPSTLDPMGRTDITNGQLVR